MNVLIVDDLPTNLKLLRAMIESAEVIVFEAEDGVQALATLECEKIDVIVSDILMPNMDGYRLCHEVRQHPRFRDLPFIFYTSTYTSDSDEKFSLEMGADRFLKKPTSSRAMLATLLEVTTESRRTYQPAAEPQEELELMKEYNQRLVEKLEKKNDDLSESQQRLSGLINNVDGVVWEADPESFRCTFISQQVERLFGYSVDRWLDEPDLWSRHVHPEDRERVLAHTRERLALLQTHENEYRFQAADGRLLWVRDTVSFIRDDGRVLKLCGIMMDITERRRVEEALRTNEADFRASFYSSAVGQAQVAPDSGRYLRVNPKFCEIAGYSEEELLGMTFYDLTYPEDRKNDSTAHERMVRGEVPEISREKRYLRKDGRTALVYINASLIRDTSGRPLRTLAVVQDITERKRAEAELQLIFDTVPALIFFKDREHRILRVNQEMARVVGLPKEAIEGRTDLELGTPHYPIYYRDEDEIFATGQAKRGLIEPLQTAIGLRWLQTDKLPYRDEAGRIVGVVGFAVDITERLETQERFRQLADNIADVFWMTDVGKQQMLYISPAYEAIWGRTCESLYETPRMWVEAIHPEDRQRIIDAALTKQKTGDYDEEYRIVRPDGSVRWIQDKGFPIRNEFGQVYRIAGVAKDVTERRQLEEQLRQSQKMEAIGQLAGGVAHDFNNLLTVIQLHASLLLAVGGSNERQLDSAQEISMCAERAAGLTRQLLTFSRKQVTQMADLDLNDLVGNLTKMLQRILGEDIQLGVKFSSAQPSIHADPGMVEQILMNLAVNARDAMPRGGRLNIETKTVHLDDASAQYNPEAMPGDFVCLSISDTGEGIAPEILPRIFEPFFTTKEVGKGTGLGLATVYGIARLHNGWITVESQVGEGTTFHTFLPRLVAAVAAPETKLARPALPSGTETILLVEDERSLRFIVRGTLEKLGYRVLEAESGLVALDVWQKHRSEIGLLLTDLVMPDGVSGRELAEQLKAESAELRIIFSSGYSADVVGKDLGLREGINFIQKPYRADKLAHTVRRALDQSE